ncbi:MAG: YncE family protein [Actinomycetota bacterium]|nr:YncE family protein [Actinomycetota bacterium]
MQRLQPSMLVALAALAACGGTSQVAARNTTAPRTTATAPRTTATAPHATATATAPRTTTSARAAVSPPPALQVQALITAETENRLVIVDLPSGRIAARTAVAADPENVAVGHGIVVVVSPRSAKVTLFDRRTLRVLRVIGGFHSPHIPAVSPDGDYVYVTDDAAGTLTSISLLTLRAISTINVGSAAHHLTFSPDGRRLWIALGESADTISIIDTADLARPRLVGGFHPGFSVHDLKFSPSGAQVWVTSASGPDVTVFSSRDRRLLFKVPVGAPPQHLVFSNDYAFLTSGYGGTIAKAALATGAVLARAHAPYGSFELDAGHGLVASSSLLRGTVAVYDAALRLLRIIRVAPAARDVAISAP